jgi:hypothetical protein
MRRYLFAVAVVCLLLSATMSWAQTHVFNLTWVPSVVNASGGTPDGYKVERAPGPCEGSSVFAQVAQPTGATTSSYADMVQNPPPGSLVFCYRVRAYNNAGNSPYSNMSQGTTAVSTPPQLAPNAPSGLKTAQITQSTIQLSWLDNSDNEIVFELSRSQHSPPRTESLLLTANTQAYRDTGLKKNTRYAYTIRALGEAGASEWSNPVMAATAK